MKILLTGGGTGGHFYPLIAIAEKLIQIAEEKKIVDLKIYYMSNSPYDKRKLFENNIKFIKIPAGKIRHYSSFQNFLDIFPMLMGLLLSLISMFFIFPDVIISKGGYAAFPAVFAGRIFKIPIIVHESDSYPGKLNLWTAKFAKSIAISWPEAINYLPKEKTALTGQPIRKSILHGNSNGAKEFFKFNLSLPVLLIIGGSQGAEKINNIIIDSLPLLISRYQIIHQTGINNFDDVVLRSNLILENEINKNNYRVIPYLNDFETRMAAGIADLIISRAGSAIFEIASWGIASIIIPITESNGDHQRKNAYSYSRAGACLVVEENNLTTHVLVANIDKLIKDKPKIDQMKKNASAFSSNEAAFKIANQSIEIALSHS